MTELLIKKKGDQCTQVAAKCAQPITKEENFPIHYCITRQENRTKILEAFYCIGDLPIFDCSFIESARSTPYHPGSLQQEKIQPFLHRKPSTACNYDHPHVVALKVLLMLTLKVRVNKCQLFEYLFKAIYLSGKN